MKNKYPEYMISHCKDISEDGLDLRVIRMWSKAELNFIRFYQTGFETILFNKDRSFALEAVLSSAVGLENEILIAGSGASLVDLKMKSKRQGVAFHAFDWFLDGWSNLEGAIAAHPGISYILVAIDSDTNVEEIPVKELLSVSEKYKTGLIVFCQSEVEGINDCFRGTIDFMVGESDTHPNCSFVVARRSKLVQTEGNSRSFNSDLYAHWQWAMRNRNSIIEPMYG